MIIKKNDDLIAYMDQAEISIRDSALKKINVYQNGDDLFIELDFQLTFSKSIKFIRLKFSAIHEYSFYHNSSHYFYDVSHCKFFKKDGAFYVSLDPVDEAEEINDEDQDFVLAGEIEGMFE